MRQGALSIQVSGAAGSWSNSASPITGREEHTATLLRNGNVLIAGGTDGRGKTLASAEVCNPATNGWTPAGPMLTARLAGARRERSVDIAKDADQRF
jgi:hypothetical protein